MINIRFDPFDPEKIDDNVLLERMRQERNILLQKSDWTQIADSPLTDAKKAEWATYRQALRDFSTTWTPSETINFPEQPS